MRKITVQIISSLEQSSSPNANNGGNDEKAAPKADATDKKKLDAAASMASQITRTITSQVMSTANYYMGKYYSMSEDYKGEQNTQNAMKTINLVTGVAGSAASLAISAGTVFGPIGAVIGAVVGAGMTLVNSAISAKNEYNEAMLAINENAYSNYFYSERAGYADMGRGTND